MGKNSEKKTEPRVNICQDCKIKDVCVNVNSGPNTDCPDFESEDYDDYTDCE